MKRLLLALVVLVGCSEPMAARQCPPGYRWVTQLDTVGWVTRQNGDTLPITIFWDGCFVRDASSISPLSTLQGND